MCVAFPLNVLQQEYNCGTLCGRGLIVKLYLGSNASVLCVTWLLVERGVLARRWCGGNQVGGLLHEFSEYVIFDIMS